MQLSDAELTTLRRWRLSTCLALVMGYIGYYLIRQNLPAAFPLLEKAFSFSNAQLGLIAASSEIVYAIGKFINGPLSDLFGGKKIFLIGLAGGLLANLAFVFGSSILWFTLVWCIGRYFLSMGWGGVAKTIGAWYEPERNGTVMGWVSVSYQFGGVVATLFAAWLVSLGQSWDKLFVYPALICIGLWIWAWLGIRETPGEVIPGARFGQGAAPMADFTTHEKVDTALIVKTLLGLPVFRLMLVFAFFITFQRSIFIFWTTKFLVDIGMGPASAIYGSALLPFLGCVGTILLGWYTDRHARGNRARVLWIMLAGLVLSLAGIALLADQGQSHHALIVLLLGLSGFFLLGPEAIAVGAMMLDVAGPRAAGTCSGLLDGVAYLGGALATFGAGQLSDTLGWTQVFWGLSVCALLALVTALGMSRQLEQGKV